MQIIDQDNLWFRVAKASVNSVRISAGKIFCYKGMSHIRYTGQYSSTGTKQIREDLIPEFDDLGHHYDVDAQTIIVSPGTNYIFLTIASLPISKTEYVTITDDVGNLVSTYDSDFITMQVNEYFPIPESASYQVFQEYPNTTLAQDYRLIATVTLTDDNMTITTARRGIICCCRKTEFVSAQ